MYTDIDHMERLNADAIHATNGGATHTLTLGNGHSASHASHGASHAHSVSHSTAGPAVIVASAIP